jgi:hypothetical protein
LYFVSFEGSFYNLKIFVPNLVILVPLH